MAAFHFSAKIHSRSEGRSAVRAAAYRAAERLYDQRAGRTEDYSLKGDVLETAILAPRGAPAWVHDREILWNRAEVAERRRDSQVAQELEINLPRELSEEENWQLAVDFAREHLVAHGRVCDMAFHMGRASDGGAHPHVHILMPTRELAGESFGQKHLDCSWKTFVKRRDRLNELREVWCDFARARALELGHDLGPEWDHRSFEDRGIDLEPQPKRGATAQRLDAEFEAGTGSRDRRAERTEEVLRTQRRNGEALLRDPMIALNALTERQSTFSDADLARYIFRHSASDQFARILSAAQARAVMVGHDRHGKPRLSTPAMVVLEAKMVADAGTLARTEAHTVSRQKVAALRDSNLSEAQRSAAAHILTEGDLTCLTGYAGSGKSTLLEAARRAWEAEGYSVRGAALSGIAAEGLRTGSGIEARTIASLVHAWSKGAEQLSARDILVIDEAGMIGSRQLADLIERVRDAGAKLVLVGDPEQLQAIDAGAAYRAVAERVGVQQLTEIWRQRPVWMREATRELAESRTAEALARYRAAGSIHARDTDDDARLHLVELWAADRMAKGLKSPDGSRIMLAHTNKDVRALNAIARDLMREDGQLGLDEAELETSFGPRAFASGDRLIFRRNDRTMDVRNGTIGTVTEASGGRMEVRLDNGRTVAFDPTVFDQIDHGYAVTCHRAQGVTVDHAFVLATRGFDRHLSYVAMTRHRDDLTLVHSRDAFGTDGMLASILGRERAKDTTLDYDEWKAPERKSPEQEAPSRDAPKQAPSETEQKFRDWAEQSVSPDRLWEWRQRNRGWGL